MVLKRIWLRFSLCVLSAHLRICLPWQYVVEFLNTKSEMLQEYFALKIEVSSNGYLATFNIHFAMLQDDCICTLPNLLDNYIPNLDKLPHFLLCLAAEVLNINN